MYFVIFFSCRVYLAVINIAMNFLSVICLLQGHLWITEMTYDNAAKIVTRTLFMDIIQGVAK